MRLAVAPLCALLGLGLPVLEASDRGLPTGGHGSDAPSWAGVRLCSPCAITSSLVTTASHGALAATASVVPSAASGAGDLDARASRAARALADTRQRQRPARAVTVPSRVTRRRADDTPPRGSDGNGDDAHPGQLCGWKQIGSYLGRGPRTAQRWHRELGLPVHRLRTLKGVAVYAYTHELDEWRQRSDGWDGPSAPMPAAVTTRRVDGDGTAGRHDDLVTLIGMACLTLGAKLRGTGSTRSRTGLVTVEFGEERVEIRISAHDFDSSDPASAAPSVSEAQQRHRS